MADIEQSQAKSIGFSTAFMLQFVNVKGWFLCMGMIATFWQAQLDYLQNIAMLVVIPIVTSVVANLLWTGLSISFTTFLRPHILQIFTKCCGLSLAAIGIIGFTNLS